MQSSSLSSLSLKVRRSQVTQSKEKLNEILRKHHRPSPFGKSSPLQVDDRPILLLIDADSVSEDLIIDWLTKIKASDLELSGWICANRALYQVKNWLTDHNLSPNLQCYQVPLGHNEADHFLMAQSEQALSANQHSAAIVYTLDRDLFKLIDAWRLAGKAVFLSPLRQNDASGQNLIQRCHEHHIILIDPSLNLMT